MGRLDTTARGSRRPGSSSMNALPGATRRPWSTPWSSAPAPRPDVQGIRARPGARGLDALAGRIKAADAFIIVSGEYNHSIPPALVEPARPLPGRVLLAALGDRLLFGRRVRRGEGRHAVAGDALRAGHAEHPVAAARTGPCRTPSTTRADRTMRLITGGPAGSSTSWNGMPTP